MEYEIDKTGRYICDVCRRRVAKIARFTSIADSDITYGDKEPRYSYLADWRPEEKRFCHRCYENDSDDFDLDEEIDPILYSMNIFDDL